MQRAIYSSPTIGRSALKIFCNIPGRCEETTTTARVEVHLVKDLVNMANILVPKLLSQFELLDD